jgi:glycosyltransferase involved in cell wall biosynthesis
MISILMPIYNGVEFFEESLTSLIDQTYSSWELLIGINGHPANSPVYQQVLQIIDHKLKKGQVIIRVFDYPLLNGKACTLNEMLKECDSLTEYVAILDVDDIWLPRKLEIQLPFLGKYDVIGTKCVYFGERNGIVPSIPCGDISQFDFFSVNPMINSSTLISKELCQWSDEFLGLDDYHLWLQLRKEGKTFFNCEEVMVKHRIHSHSAFNAQGNGNRVKDLLDTFSNI